MRLALLVAGFDETAALLSFLPCEKSDGSFLSGSRALSLLWERADGRTSLLQTAPKEQMPARPLPRASAAGAGTGQEALNAAIGATVTPARCRRGRERSDGPGPPPKDRIGVPAWARAATGATSKTVPQDRHACRSGGFLAICQEPPLSSVRDS